MTLTHFDSRLSVAGLLACLLVVVAGCGTGPEGGSLNGTWIGQAGFKLPGDLIAPPSSVTLVTHETIILTGETTMATGEVKGTITFEAGGQSVCAPVTGTHEYPDFSLRFGLAGEEVTGGYVGKATIRNCTSKFGSPDWCGMEGTFSTDDGAVSAALTLTMDPSAFPTLDPSTLRPVCD